jgi:serine/threonine-protein kinase
VGRELGVGAVLEGTVRRASGRLRLTAQLTSVDDGLVLWAETYEREVQDVFAVQDDIARAIVAALRPRLTRAPGTAITVAGTRDPDAHELYLRARHFWSRRVRFDDATALLRQAVARDSSYAQAWAALASIYAVLPDWSTATVDTTNARGKEYARRALALDPSLGEAHAALGNMLQEEGRLDDAEREFRAAVAVEPGNAPTRHWYGLLLSLRGRVEDAARELQRAHELDPLAPNIHAQYAAALAVTGREAEAERQLRALIAAEPAFGASYFHLASVLVARGRVDEALAWADTARRRAERGPGVAAIWPLGVVGAVEARAGRTEDARRTLARVRTLGASDTRGWRGTAEAMIFLALGEPDSALAALRREAELGRLAALQYADLSTLLTPLRADPRYAEIFRSAGIRP